MSQQTVVLDLPESLYERVRRQAENANRPVEDVLTESIALLFGEAEPDASVESLQDRTDAELWALVRRRMTWDLEARIDTFSALARTRSLLPDEIQQRDVLIAEVDHYVLMRSAALLLLKQRGNDVDRYLKAVG
ncbi:MAG: hypothetical protein JNL42_00100 [Anaerolineae bacterium]|nr:hypothetical protein [Anaerolineae bacterium]